MHDNDTKSAEKIAGMQAKVDKAFQSGEGQRTMNQIEEEARGRLNNANSDGTKGKSPS